MTNVIQDIWRQHGRAGLIVDTNILLLLLVGQADERLITSFKRTRQFTVDDFQQLVRFVGGFDQILTTPCILAEVNSLAGQFPEHARTIVIPTFVKVIGILNETHRASREVAASEAFRSVGLTDAGILELAASRLLVLTDDFRLAGLLQSRGGQAINFNHLRQYLLE